MRDETRYILTCDRMMSATGTPDTMMVGRMYKADKGIVTHATQDFSSVQSKKEP